jgi:hypothetical protein
MKKLFPLVLLFLGFATSPLFAQEPTVAECKQFRTGTFYVKGMPNVVVTRDENFQIETDTKTGKYIKMSIVWIDDCTYQLKTVKTNHGRKQKKLDKKIGTLTIVITSVEADGKSYQFSASSAAMSEPVRGTIEKKQ